jgi:hypothetical protein
MVLLRALVAKMLVHAHRCGGNVHAGPQGNVGADKSSPVHAYAQILQAGRRQFGDCGGKQDFR